IAPFTTPTCPLAFRNNGTTVRVEFGDATTVADSAGAHAISQSFPHTYGQHLVHFLRETAKVHDAQIISNHPAMRVGLEIHSLLRHGISVDKISTQLSPWASALFEFLPPFIRKQLLLHPESDDSAQLSQIEIDKLLAELVEAEMSKRQKEGSYKGKKFNAICHFFGYQARGSLPSKFDCDYAYVLGHICYHILAAGLNGYMATVTNLKNPSNKWRCGAAPITAMLSIKHDGRAMTIGKPLVHPATVDLRGKVYELLRQNARKLLLDDIYRNPGPLQFDGPGVDSRVVSLYVEDLDYMGRIKELNEYLDKVRSIVKPGCSQDVVKAALSAMSSVTRILSVMSSNGGGA
ncbi:hypothetical protein M8C21_007771, partial [Ambrosia artemisiifolia]